MLAGLKGMNGQLEFVSGEDMEVLNAAEHFLAAEIEWDPTGRYVATAVTALQKMENGLNLWLFNGQLIYRFVPRVPSRGFERLYEKRKVKEGRVNQKSYCRKRLATLSQCFKDSYCS